MEMAPPCVPGSETAHAVEGQLASLFQIEL
jgi:hypothetical protein